MMVVLDTNFVTLPAQFGVDIFCEISEKIPGARLVTVSQVVDELKRLDKKGRVGLSLIKKFGVKVVKKEGGTDDALLELADENKGVLCTNDKELKKRALEKKIAVMFMRKKKILELAGGLNV